jgi:outer membrane lipoprotein-sorting protein
MKKTFVSSVLLLTCALHASNGTPSQPADLNAILQEFHRRMANVKSVYMEYTQEKVMKLFSEPLKTEGVMMVAQPNRLRWETTAPYQSIMLGERKHVAQFEYNDGKWEKLKLGYPQALERLMQQMSAMQQGRIEAMTNECDISVTNDTDIVMTMVPKNETVRSFMTSVEIHLAPDSYTTRSVVMNEPNGDLTRITFRNEKHDVELPAGTFDLDNPLPIAEVKTAVAHAP